MRKEERRRVLDDVDIGVYSGREGGRRRRRGMVYHLYLTELVRFFAGRFWNRDREELGLPDGRMI